MEHNRQTPATIRVWDVPTRVVHWLLFALVAFSLVTGLLGDPSLIENHMLAGEIILALVLFRIVWGFAGSPRSRFGDFVPGPRAVVAYLRDRRVATPGHNPLGAFSVLGLLALLLVQTVTGLFANDDIWNEGPLAGNVSKDLSDRMTGIHELSGNLLIALIVLHVAVVVAHRLKGDNLILAMVTGRKDRTDADWEDRPYASTLLALALLAACGGVVRLLTML